MGNRLYAYCAIGTSIFFSQLAFVLKSAIGRGLLTRYFAEGTRCVSANKTSHPRLQVGPCHSSYSLCTGSSSGEQPTMVAEWQGAGQEFFLLFQRHTPQGSCQCHDCFEFSHV